MQKDSIVALYQHRDPLIIIIIIIIINVKITYKIHNNICAKFNENRTHTFLEITASITNEQTNKQTNKLAWSQYILEEVTDNQRMH